MKKYNDIELKFIPVLCFTFIYLIKVKLDSFLFYVLLLSNETLKISYPNTICIFYTYLAIKLRNNIDHC